MIIWTDEVWLRTKLKNVTCQLNSLIKLIYTIQTQLYHNNNINDNSSFLMRTSYNNNHLKCHIC
ncbi:hypothetical protein KSF78_0001232 [Schistosoma japonicum]|nr:hypothetical protein KSF78_0001232 [Schistosoma japonicum]